MKDGSMCVGSVTVKLYAPGAHSLKDKRMIVWSLRDRLRNKFNLSVAEVGAMDNHQVIVMGVACVSNSVSHMQNMLDEVVRFVEAHCEAEITEVTQNII